MFAFIKISRGSRKLNFLKKFKNPKNIWLVLGFNFNFDFQLELFFTQKPVLSSENKHKSAEK